MAMVSDSADTLIITLERAEADLTAVAHRLEEGEPVSPGAANQETRKELIDNAKSQLIGNYKALESLEQRSGTNVQSGTTETFQAFEAAIAEWDNKLGLPAKPSETLICSLTARAAPVNATRNGAYEIAGAQDTDLNQALLTSVLQASS